MCVLHIKFSMINRAEYGALRKPLIYGFSLYIRGAWKTHVEFATTYIVPFLSKIVNKFKPFAAELDHVIFGPSSFPFLLNMSFIYQKLEGSLDSLLTHIKYNR